MKVPLMPRWPAHLTLNHKLGLAALGLGVVAVAATVTPGRTVTFNAKELLTRIDRQDDHVSPAALAAWIIDGRADHRLIDIRSPAAFAAYHIPTAEDIPLAQLADGALARSDKIVLYGDGGIHAAQGWMVLSAMGYRRVYTLLEGLDAWKDEVLYPTAPEHPTAEASAGFARSVQIAKFFGGQPRAAAAPPAAMATPAAGGAAPAPPLPPVLAPSLPAGTPAGAPAKKKREGC